MFSSLYQLVSQCFFVTDITFLLIYEYGHFCIHKKYKQFIYNISRGLARKNILYVKIFQAISMNNKFIDAETNNELLKYTDSVPYTSEDVNHELLDHIIKQYKLKSVDPILKPINSGMISLVYKFTCENNVPIIIKMKRKNIDETLCKAMERLQSFIHILSYIPYLHTFNISTTVTKNILLLKEQLHFAQEVKNTISMAQMYKHIKYIKIPYVYEEVTKDNPDIIMMEYIHGVHISKVDDNDYETYAKLVLKFGFISLINYGFTHGDLHSGNILFIKNKLHDNNKNVPVYQIGLIDFGVVIQIHKKMMELFLDIATTIFSDPGRIIAKKLIAHIIHNFETIPDIHKENIYDEVEAIINKVIYKSREATQLKIYEFIHNLNTYVNKNHLKKFNITINDDFVKLQMGLAMAHGISMHLCKNDYITFANKVLADLFHVDLLFMEDA